MPAQNRRNAVIALSAGLILAGVAGWAVVSRWGRPAVSPSVTSDAVAATPEEAFAAARGCAEKKDWPGFLALTDAGSVDMLLMTLAFAAGVSAEGNDSAKSELAALSERHHVRNSEPGEAPGRNAEEMKETARWLFANVADKPALFGELVDFADRHGREATRFLFAGTTLKQVAVDGDEARGTIADASGKPVPIHFARRNGRWILVFSK